MSLLDLTEIIDEIEEAQEPGIAENGSEHKLRIVSCRGGEAGQNECPYFSPVFEVTDDPLVKEFSAFLWVPTKSKMSEKQYARSLSDLKNFVKCFDVDITRPLDFEDDLPGHEGWAILGIKNSDEYGEQNVIRKYVVGQ